MIWLREDFQIELDTLNHSEEIVCRTYFFEHIWPAHAVSNISDKCSAVNLELIFTVYKSFSTFCFTTERIGIIREKK